MKNNTKKYIYYAKLILVICLILFILSGCSASNADDKIKAKVSSEINYFENEIFAILVKYAKGEYNTENGLDWNGMYKESRKITESWSSVVLDLSKLNISKEQINGLGQDLSNIIISISSENLLDVFNYLYSAYSRLPEIKKLYSENDIEIRKLEFKKLVVLAYKQAEEGNFESSKNEIKNASDKYSDMMNDVNYSKENSYNLNKIFVEIEELKSAIDLENLPLIRIRFVNFIEEI